MATRSDILKNLHNYKTNVSWGSSNTTSTTQVETYNPRYPWFDEANYKKLESKVDALWLTWYEKEQAMDNFYVQVLPLVQDEIKNSERRKFINDASYEVSQIQDKGARIQAKWKLTVTELSQQLKEKYNIDPTANDEEVFNSWIESIPNWWQLLANYMNTWDRTLLYAWGLAQKTEAPISKESSVWGIQSVINKESEINSDSTLWEINKVADWVNIPWKVTELVDGLVQKIPVVTFDTQVENLANKMNNLSEEEVANLYNKYVKMVKNWTDKKWKNDKRWPYELIWDAITWDKDALDRVNTLYTWDYSEAMPQDWVERNQWGDQLLWGLNTEIKDDDNLIMKWAKWIVNLDKNLLNFIGWSWGWLENYAEALGVGIEKMKQIDNNQLVTPMNLENNENAFKAFVADKTANFGESLVDAPNTLMGANNPNLAKIFANAPASFVKNLSAKVRWATNPLDTKVWLVKMLLTDEWQQAMIDRYWSIDNLTNTMNYDPVWLADDMIDRVDKANRATNKVTGWAVSRNNIGSYTDALSSKTVWNINQWLTNLSNRFKNKWFDRTSNLVNLERDVSTNPSKVKEDVEEIAYQWAKDLWTATRATIDTVENLPEKMQEWAYNLWKKLGEISDEYNKKSQEVWQKAKDTATRSIPEKVIENDLKLTPTERANVEKNWTTAANFILKEWIWWLNNEDKIVALQDIATDAYNKVTNTFKDKIPNDVRVESTDAPKMLQVMVDTMEKSDIVKAEYGDYIDKLKEMKDYSDYSPYELLAIRRDFDAIVWNDIFNSKGRVTWLEDQIIAWYRASLNDKLNEIWDKYKLDVKDQNSRISNSITIRDWLIRANSQWKKNNYIWLKDLWIWAVLSAWDPIVWATAVIGSKIWDAKSWKIAQSVYNLNKEAPKKTNTRKWPWFIKKANKDASNRFMISSSSNNTSSDWLQ